MTSSVPLYGLDRLAARPDAPVIVTQSDRACDAAGIIFQKYVNVTWTGGCNARQEADWSPLAGRKVLAIPDADPDGVKAMGEVAYHLVRKIGIAELQLVRMEWA
jgi:putative DNA primase/helicase